MRGAEPSGVRGARLSCCDHERPRRRPCAGRGADLHGGSGAIVGGGSRRAGRQDRRHRRRPGDHAPGRLPNSGDRPPGADGDARVPGRACAPHSRRSRPDPVRAPRRTRRRALPRDRGRVRGHASRCRMDPGRRLVAGGLPGRPAAPRGSRSRRPRSPGVPAQPRRARRLGQQPGTGACRHHRRHPGPGRRPHRARRRRLPAGHPPRGGHGSREPARPIDEPRRAAAAPCEKASDTCIPLASRPGRTPG